MLVVFLITLYIAPQVWLQPFVGLPVDYIIYPVWLIVALARGRFMARGIQHSDLMFIGFLLWLGVSTVVNGFHPGDDVRHMPSSLGFLRDYSKFFLLFQLVIAEIPNLKKADHLGRWILFFACVLVVESVQHKLHPEHLGWAGQRLGWVDPSVLAEGGTGRTRWVSIFDGPGVFCVVFTAALPFALRYLDTGQSLPRKILGTVTTLGLIVAVYLNGSRGGFLTTLALLALYAGLRYRLSLTKMALGAVLSLTLFMAAPSHLSTMRDDSRSADHRVDMWAEGIEMVTYYPVFGVGRGNFVNYSSRLIAHNSAIEILGEMGLVGGFFWVALIYLCAKGVWMAYVSATQRRTKSLLVAIGLSLAGYLISSMFVTLEYATFYLLLGLCAAAAMATGQRLMLTRKDLRNILGLMAVWLVLLKAFVMSYY